LNTNSLKIAGYITSNSLKKGFIAHNIQNNQIRSFVQMQKHNYLLSWTEFLNKCPFVFNNLLQENFYNGICFYSIEQLYDFPNSIDLLINLSKSNLWIGFAAEGLFFQSDYKFDQVLQIFKLKKLTDGSREDLKFLWAF
jgi:sporadic carbohydrate cluster protein (TIGR04323 family)